MFWLMATPLCVFQSRAAVALQVEPKTHSGGGAGGGGSASAGLHKGFLRRHSATTDTPFRRRDKIPYVIRRDRAHKAGARPARLWEIRERRRAHHASSSSLPPCAIQFEGLMARALLPAVPAGPRVAFVPLADVPRAAACVSENSAGFA